MKWLGTGYWVFSSTSLVGEVLCRILFILRTPHSGGHQLVYQFLSIPNRGQSYAMCLLLGLIARKFVPTRPDSKLIENKLRDIPCLAIVLLTVKRSSFPWSTSPCRKSKCKNKHKKKCKIGVPPHGVRLLLYSCIGSCYIKWTYILREVPSVSTSPCKFSSLSHCQVDIFLSACGCFV